MHVNVKRFYSEFHRNFLLPVRKWKILGHIQYEENFHHMQRNQRAGREKENVAQDGDRRSFLGDITIATRQKTNS